MWRFWSPLHKPRSRRRTPASWYTRPSLDGVITVFHPCRTFRRRTSLVYMYFWDSDDVIVVMYSPLTRSVYPCRFHEPFSISRAVPLNVFERPNLSLIFASFVGERTRLRFEVSGITFIWVFFPPPRRRCRCRRRIPPRASFNNHLSLAS